VLVELAIPASRCALVAAENLSVMEPGVFELRVGPSSRRSRQLAATFLIHD
jgi:beta-glucosidase